MSEQLVPERAEVQDIERHMQRVKARELKRKNRSLRHRSVADLARLVRDAQGEPAAIIERVMND